MSTPLAANSTRTGPARRRRSRGCAAVWLCVALILPLSVPGRAAIDVAELQALTRERETLTRELEQYEKTLAVLQTDGTPPEESSNPAVRTLVQERVRIKERIIAITEREVSLLQEQITEANAAAGQAAAVPPAAPAPAETKPVRVSARDFSARQEKENVARLYELLTNHYAELQEAARTLPTEEEIERRKAALADARTLAKIPFSADKVRLSGAEGSMALAQITQRLSDPNLPESRRDIEPICSIRTRLFGSLIASETHSLKPVGKHHYLARIRLQPGDTTLRIQGDLWDIRLPHDISAGDYLVTLYHPPGSSPELHLFAVDDLLAEERAHIPAWLPEELALPSHAG